MNSFYIQLQAELADAKEELWAQTQIDGAEAGKKTLLKGEPENTDSVFVDEKGERVFQERISRPAKLVICGAGHVSMPIIRMGKMLGFHVTVVEDRPKFADDARREQADQVYCEPFEDGLAKIKGDTDTWFVIVTRGHRYDTDCLRTILGKPRAYVGMMGSKRRTAIVKDQLEAEGFEREVLEAVHTPIGLKIAAETPEEIAVSIMAEIIQIKNSRAKSGGYSGELLEGADKLRAVVKPGGRAGVLDADAVVQKLFGLGDAALDDIVVERRAGFVFEQPAEIVFVDVQGVRHLGGLTFPEIALNVANGLFRPQFRLGFRDHNALLAAIDVFDKGKQFKQLRGQKQRIFRLLQPQILFDVHHVLFVILFFQMHLDRQRFADRIQKIKCCAIRKQQP